MMRWRHPHTFLSGLLAGGLSFATHPWAWLLAGVIAGALTYTLLHIGVRLLRRVDRALPDHDRESGSAHPCAGPDCNTVVYGRRSYCSETCREVAAEERMRRKVHAERLADFGELPY